MISSGSGDSATFPWRVKRSHDSKRTLSSRFMRLLRVLVANATAESRFKNRQTDFRPISDHFWTNSATTHQNLVGTGSTPVPILLPASEKSGTRLERVPARLLDKAGQAEVTLACPTERIPRHRPAMAQFFK